MSSAASFNPLGLTYCEDEAWGMIAQPWNTLSNIGFLLVTWALWRLYRSLSAREQRLSLAMLIGSPVLIALGSTIWHTTQVGWTLWIDIASIALFAVLYIFYGGQQFANWSLTRIIFILAAIGALCGLSSWALGDIIPQRSGGFIPLIFVILFMAYATIHHSTRTALWFIAAVLSLVIALVMRISDLALCDLTPAGTHYIWHILTALTVYMLVRGLFQLIYESQTVAKSES